LVKIQQEPILRSTGREMELKGKGGGGRVAYIISLENEISSTESGGCDRHEDLVTR